MQANQLDFITLLSGDKLQQDIAAQAQRQNDRRGAFDQVLAGLTDAKKEEIRKAMNVRVVEKSTKQEISYSDKGGLKDALAGLPDAKQEEIRKAMKVRVVDKPGKNQEAALSDKVLEDALAGLPDAKKKEIRKAMSLRVDDKAGKKQESAFSDKGQEDALDTFKATRKGRGLTKEDMKKVGAALKMISDAAQGVLTQKTSDGKPLFDTQAEFELALTQELFTPLVREGVLPENFVIDQYSEVQQLLNASFRSYKARLTGQKDEQEGKDAVQAVKRAGAGDGVLGSQRLDQFLAGAKWLAGTPDRILDKGQQAVGMSNTTRRRVGVAMDVGKQAYSGAQALVTLSTLAPGPDGRPKMLNSAEVQLDPSKAAIFDRINGTESLPVDPDVARTMIAHDKMEAKIKVLGLPAGLEDAVLKAIFMRREETGSVATFDWTKGYATDLKTLIKDIGLKGYDTFKLDEARHRRPRDRQHRRCRQGRASHRRGPRQRARRRGAARCRRRAEGPLRSRGRRD